MASEPSTVVLEFEITRPFPQTYALQRQARAEVLCRLHGRPLAKVWVPVVDGRVREQDVTRELLDKHAWTFATRLAECELTHAPDDDELHLERLFASPSMAAAAPLVTVSVCTRDRTDDLRRCLAALCEVDYPAIDLLVVDNAPTTEHTRELVETEFPQVRYVREPRPGLDWARNRAILECRGEILAYTDDDVIVDRGWVSALVAAFAADPGVMAVTGLVIPHELDTPAQRLFEAYGGFGRGFVRRWYRAPRGSIARRHGGTGKFGTGANMAFRRRLFDNIGGFDPALDVGTCTNGGGDLEMFFRVLKTGHTLVYEPAALVRHRHRRTYQELRTQIANNGIGFYSYLMRTRAHFVDEGGAIASLAVWWFRWWSLRRLVRALLRKEKVPLDLVIVELLGSLRGLFRYRRAQHRADELRAAFPDEPTLTPVAVRGGEPTKAVPEAVRMVDVARPLQPITDAAEYERVRLIVARAGVPIGSVTIHHYGAAISTRWLEDVITQHLAAELLDARVGVGRTVLWARLVAEASRQLGVHAAAEQRGAQRRRQGDQLSEDVSVSIVVATYDRPADLRRCLDSLSDQRTARPFQIIVVDNHPASGVTRQVVADYPQVVLVDEHRGGLSYARNRGIACADGDIILTTDDDVVCPPDWVERLVAPFAEADVMVVTGNVLPIALDTDAARMFEAYGGLGRGFSRFRVDHEWFRRFRKAVPTWQLGCTANAAFRASIFRDASIGLMDEALGAGTPTGCSEDTYVFYRVLKAGYAMVYDPRAYVWHRHRDSLAALRKQIYAYSKGHVAYHLTTWLRDGDIRGLVRVAYELPVTHMKRVYQRLRGWNDYPMRLLWLEVLGNLAGPLALWRSRRRVRALGKSTPLIADTPALNESHVNVQAI